FPGEFSVDPQPETYFELVKYGEAYTLTALLRYQANAFFETTERLPEISWEVARTPLFNSPLFYEATTSAAWLERAFPFGSPNPNYNTFRFDSFHQIVMPMTLFHWLSVVPRFGLRGTYYDKTGEFVEATPENGLPAGILNVQGNRFRFIYNAGLESSFKLSRAYENVQARWLGLDGLRHIIQPYANFSFVSSPTVAPQNILPFDRYITNTWLPPIDFPQFNSVDSINGETVLRVGVRNRLLTRRDNSTLNWFDLDTYFDVDFDNPYSQFPGSTFSNVFNRLRFTPVPWLSLAVDSQLPLFDRGFTEVNTSLDWTVNPNLYVRLGHRYLYENPNLQDSSDITFAGYLRFNENWGFSIYEDYEMATGIINEQDYAIHRDLSSWTASLGIQARNNGGGKTSVGLILTFTLKDLPRFGLPADLNVGQVFGE
ncbi:MAG: LPS assembly protein LptD, partial [Verrucomicrobia bacterium]|nr:LPS assembly protein LptD [Verrucomicrobiota bacterium]